MVTDAVDTKYEKIARRRAVEVMRAKCEAIVRGSKRDFHNDHDANICDRIADEIAALKEHN